MTTHTEFKAELMKKPRVRFWYYLLWPKYQIIRWGIKLATKQEEIREGLAEVLSFSQLFDTEWNDMEESAKQLYEKQATIVLSYLHSHNVVIKVEGYLPENPLDKAELFDVTRRQYKLGNFIFDDLYRIAHNTGFNKAREGITGYVATESLIEDKREKFLREAGYTEVAK